MELENSGYSITTETSGSAVFEFLGIKLTMTDKNIKLTQHGLIKKLVDTTGMSDCNGISTPANIQPLSTDADGAPFKEDWKYASAVGMMLYLASNAYPEIQFAVHQCARFTHCPRHIHAQAIKNMQIPLICTPR